MTYVRLLGMMLIWAWGFLTLLFAYLFLRYMWKEYWRRRVQDRLLDWKLNYLFWRQRNK